MLGGGGGGEEGRRELTQGIVMAVELGVLEGNE